MPTATSITQFGVTFTFDSAVEYGIFADGSYGVVGPVTITSITPDWDGEHNGWEINPTVQLGQAFSNYNGGATSPILTFDADLLPALPYTTSGECSIVKAIGRAGSGSNDTYIQTAVVLTVLNSIPSGGWSAYFRPPYVGTAKPLYAVADLQTALLPSLPHVGTPPSLSSVVTQFSKCLRMDHHNTYPRHFRPSDALADYQPENVNPVIDAMLRLLLDDPIEDRLPALIQLTQPCIDRLHAVMLGYRSGSTGHNPGHRTMAGWAAVMLNIEEGLAYLVSEEAPGYQEEAYLVWNGERALWGLDSSTESQYWNYIRGLGGNQSHKDPYGYIDGGAIIEEGAGGTGSAYQKIVSQNLKAAALISVLMPELQVSWRPGHFPVLRNYAERWVSHGVWAQPDPAAPYTPEGVYQVDYGPDPENPGNPILGSGRFPQFHGANADGGQYKSAFVGAMWTAYWPNEEVQVAFTRPRRTRSRLLV